MNKDLIILKLLLAWEIIHLSKKGENLTLRLREYKEKDSRFIRVKFLKCQLISFLDLNYGQIDDLDFEKFRSSMFYGINEEADGILSIQIIKGKELLGFLKILPNEIGFEFTTK